ncbi:hypothetical protein THAOC_00383 [Thalassiosira oceanica]|uniref:Inositol polyphosphate-related phosphatase domain-containing protein n=1 Tax=Thalassiosira oceanica TaxID=159749 RepID=K0TPA6_THAOC|nr:hypothetical protein THAOC_00383 [Thalassiosira oceanica]|eukprot:EJK77766.1 hypothetical protein THAOC_00383 [Thalassiosira oceanica]
MCGTLRFVSSNLTTLPGITPRPGRGSPTCPASFVSSLLSKSVCIPQAYPEVRPVGREVAAEGVVVPLALEHVHGRVVGPHAGEDDDGRIVDLGRMRDVDDLVAARCDGVADGADVARPVVEEGDRHFLLGVRAHVQRLDSGGIGWTALTYLKTHWRKAWHKNSMKSLFPLSTLFFYTEPRIALLVEGRSWDISLNSQLAPRKWMDSRHPGPSLELGDVEHARQTVPPISVLLLRGGSDRPGYKPHKRRRRKKRSEIPGSANNVDSRVHSEADTDSADGSDDSIQVKDDHVGAAATADGNSQSKTGKKRIRRRVVEAKSEPIETPTKRKKRKRKVNQVDDDTTRENNGPGDSTEINVPDVDKRRTSRKRRKRTGPDRGLNPDVNELTRSNLKQLSKRLLELETRALQRRQTSTDPGQTTEVADDLDDVEGTREETDEEKTDPDIIDVTETINISSEPVIPSKKKKRRRKKSAKAPEQESNTTEWEPANEGGPRDEEVIADEHPDDADSISIEASVDIPAEEIVPESIDPEIGLDDSIDSPASLEQLSVNVSLDEEEEENTDESPETVIPNRRKKRRRKKPAKSPEQDGSHASANEGSPRDDEMVADEHSDDAGLISIEASVDIPTEEIVPESIDPAIGLDDSLSSSDESIGSPASLEQLSVKVSLDEEEAVSDENLVAEEVIEHAEPTIARGSRDEEPPSLVLETSVELPGEEVVPESIDAEVEIEDNIPIEPLDQYSEVEVPDEIIVASQDPKEKEDKTDEESEETHPSPDADDSVGGDKEPINEPEGRGAVLKVPETEVDEPSAIVDNAQEDLSEIDIKVEDGKEVDADAGMTKEYVEQSETVSVAEPRSPETVHDESHCEHNEVIGTTADDAASDNDRTTSPLGGATEEADPDLPEQDPEESVAETAKTEDSVDEKMNGRLSDDSEGHSNTSEEVVSITDIVSSDQDRFKMDDDCLKLSVVTWNLAEKAPPEEDAAFFRRFRKDSEGEGSDLVLIGAQECEEIKPRRTEGHRSRHLRRLGIMMLGKDYVPLAIHSLGGIQCALYCHRDRLGDVEMINIADVTCGVGNVLHNKGAIGLFLKMKCNSSGRASRILLVTGHLAAHVKNVDARNADFHRIVSELEAQAPARFLRPKMNRDGSPAECDGSRLLDSMDHVFFAGDLNYRVDLPREHVEKCIVDMKRSPSRRGKLMSKLLRRDQLLQTIASGQAFAGFDEGKISFLPTFKFDKGSSDYDTSHKQRVPAWTDRILFRAKQKVRVCEYESVADSMHSDHRPVLGTFQLGWGVEATKKKARKRRRSR